MVGGGSTSLPKHDAAIGEAIRKPAPNAPLATRRRGLCSCPVYLLSQEASVARVAISDPKRRTAYEPLYDIDPQTGASVEIFYADPAVARSFGTSEAGWFWWTCHSGSLPHDLPSGPFANSYLAYRDVATRWTNTDGPRSSRQR